MIEKTKVPLITTKDIEEMLKTSKRSLLVKFMQTFYEKRSREPDHLLRNTLNLITPVVVNSICVLFTCKGLDATRSLWADITKNKIDTFMRCINSNISKIYIIAEEDWNYLDRIIRVNFCKVTRTCTLPDIDFRVYEEHRHPPKSSIVKDAIKIFGPNITIIQ